ncbi:glycoside hydrolase [Termitidicoccus mucosus]
MDNQIKAENKMKNLRALASMALISGLMTVCRANTNDGDESRVRISWDNATYQEMTEVRVGNRDFVEKNLSYPRIKKLKDGTLLMSFNNHHVGWNVYVRRSEDNGETWGDAQMLREKHRATSTVGRDEKVFINSDFIQLQDGRILLAYQWRYRRGYGDIPNTNDNCGIEIMFSEDSGRTFSKPREIYRGRCWEPAMLQLPSGEIQMYITSSQEVVNKISNPRTVVIRSMDGGKTWQGKELCTWLDNETISRTFDERASYDGMPSGVWLDDNNGIAVPIEVWHGRHVMDQTPVVVKTPADVNWRIDHEKVAREGGPDYPWKKQINKDLWAYGPYSAKLGTGEVVVLCNGTYKGVEGIWTLIGDKKADNFRFATSPFKGYWGSIDDIGNNEVIATAMVKYAETGKERYKVLVIKGRLNYAKTIAKGDLTMAPINQFDKSRNDYWFLGKEIDSQVFVNFGYTDREFQFATYLFDKALSAFTPQNSDASAMLLNRTVENGRSQNYKITVNAAGQYTVYKEERYSWVLIGKGITNNIEVEGTVNNDEDQDLGFAAKVSVDWNLLGGKPTAKDQFRAHLIRYYKGGSKEKPLSTREDMAGENSDYPQEWLQVMLN